MGTRGGSDGPVTQRGNTTIPAGEASVSAEAPTHAGLGARAGVGNVQGEETKGGGQEPVQGAVQRGRIKHNKGGAKKKGKAVPADRVMPPYIVVREYKNGTTPDSETQVYTTKWYYVYRTNKDKQK